MWCTAQVTANLMNSAGIADSSELLHSQPQIAHVQSTVFVLCLWSICAVSTECLCCVCRVMHVGYVRWYPDCLLKGVILAVCHILQHV